MSLVKSLIGFGFFVAGLLILAAGFGFVPMEQLATIGLIWPAILIGAGILLMLRLRRGSLPILFIAIAVLIGLFAFSVGFQPTATIKTFNTPFDPNFNMVNADIEFHGGTLTVHQAIEMYTARMKYTSKVEPYASAEVSGSIYNVDFGELVTAPNIAGGYSGSHNWDIGLNGNLPLNLSLTTTGSETDLDLTQTELASLDISTSFSLIKLKFGKRVPTINAKINGAFSRFEILIPQEAGLSVKSSIFGSSNLRQAGFDEVRTDEFVSKNFDLAPVKIFLDVDAGASAMAVTYFDLPPE